jgi:hypothetical protein
MLFWWDWHKNWIVKLIVFLLGLELKLELWKSLLNIGLDYLGRQVEL